MQNTDADQLCSDRTADQRLWFPYIASSRNFKPLAIFYGCTDWFVSDLVGNPEDRFSQNEAQVWTVFSWLSANLVPKSAL